MSAQQGHPAASLLQDLADEAKVNAEFWQEFEFRLRGGEIPQFKRFFSSAHLFGAIMEGNYEIRRRPKTVRVSGEVPEEVIEAAKWAAEHGMNGHYVKMLGETLLSLVEESK